MTSEPHQIQIDSADSDQLGIYARASAFLDLQPIFLKCLFSYAFFFVTTDNAYSYFYKQLNRANHLSDLNVKHGKPPKRSAFVKKIRLIRDIAIAHFPSNEADPIDAIAAMQWQPMALGRRKGDLLDLEKLTFGPGKFRGTDPSGKKVSSQDMEITGLKTAHYDHCLPYLKQYDEMCCSYLIALQDAIRE